MEALFFEYPPCSTCKKAKKYLLEHHIAFQPLHIVTQTPTIAQLQKWISVYDIDINKLFNTSGNVYKENHLKERMPTLSTSEKLALLADNGMLIKRPLFISDTTMLIGFKEESYQKLT